MTNISVRLFIVVLAGMLIACGRAAVPSADEAGRSRRAASTTLDAARPVVWSSALAAESPAVGAAASSSARAVSTKADARAATAQVTFELVVLGNLPPRASIYWFTRQTHDGQWPSGPAPPQLCGPDGEEYRIADRPCAGGGTVYATRTSVERTERLHYSYSATGLGRRKALGASDTRRFTGDSTVRVYGNLPIVPVGKARSYRLGTAGKGDGLTVGETLPPSGRTPLYIQLAYGDAVNQLAPLTCDRPSFLDLYVGEQVRWRSRISLDCKAEHQLVTVRNESPAPVGVSFVAIRGDRD